MNIEEVEILARGIMDRFGLLDWDFAFDGARRRAGLTDFRRRRISLSRPLMQRASDAMIRDTILHEVAHALVGPTHGHDTEWKKVATALGATPRSRVGSAPVLDPKWRGICPRGHVIYRYRRSREEVSCARCSPHFDTRFTFRWEQLR